MLRIVLIAKILDAHEDGPATLSFPVKDVIRIPGGKFVLPTPNCIYLLTPAAFSRSARWKVDHVPQARHRSVGIRENSADADSADERFGLRQSPNRRRSPGTALFSSGRLQPLSLSFLRLHRTTFLAAIGDFRSRPAPQKRCTTESRPGLSKKGDARAFPQASTRSRWPNMDHRSPAQSGPNPAIPSASKRAKGIFADLAGRRCGTFPRAIYERALPPRALPPQSLYSRSRRKGRPSTDSSAWRRR
jgi:hypothetical protein